MYSGDRNYLLRHPGYDIPIPSLPSDFVGTNAGSRYYSTGIVQGPRQSDCCIYAGRPGGSSG